MEWAIIANAARRLQFSMPDVRIFQKPTADEDSAVIVSAAPDGRKGFAVAYQKLIDKPWHVPHQVT